ncbi:MAG: response regulator [Nitrospinae bacterium]|nr:response regulator [Nitrospinota bacterium]
METKTILLVEDNEDDIELTLRAMKKHNIANKVDVVKDGSEALEYLFCTGKYSHKNPNEHPQLVLLDLKLPKIGGLEVLKKIREDARTKYLPVVILTSSKEESDVMNGYKMHVNSYIRKPVDFNQFAEAIRQLGMYWLLLNEPPPSIGNGVK